MRNSMPRRPDPVEIEPDAWCAWCGDPLPEPEERDPRQIYCSRQCNSAMAYDLRKPPPAEPRRVTCAWCGTEFDTHRPGARFCSKTCHRKHLWRTTPDTRDRTKPPPPPRPCIECGETFQPRRKDKLYCSRSCGNKHRNRRWRAKG